MHLFFKQQLIPPPCFEQGFSIYLVLMGKNYAYESKTEDRYRNILIVCNVQPSSGPIDTDALSHQASQYNRLLLISEEEEDARSALRMANAVVRAGGSLGFEDNDEARSAGRPRDHRQAIQRLQDEMDIDKALLRKGLIRKDPSSKVRCVQLHT